MALKGLFSKIKEPIVLKQSSSFDKLLKLKNLYKTAVNIDRDKLARDIKFLESGIYGEQQVLFELLSSNVPMYILHDINLQYKDLRAQIDFIVITKKCVYVIEAKNLKGNILINSNGDFISELYNKSIYNPITQNRRHLEIIKNKILDNKNFIDKIIANRIFNKMYKSLVVFTNKECYIKDWYADKKVKGFYVKIDRLIDYIRQNDQNVDNYITDKDMKEIADSFINSNVSDDNYLEKYVMYDDLLINALKEYRKNRANLENIKPYMVFNDNTLEDLVCKRPLTLNDLMKINGLGQYKVSKYGTEILDIISKFDNKNQI